MPARLISYILGQISFFGWWRPWMVDSVHPPPLMPRWGTALHFVIPSAAEGSAVRPSSRSNVSCAVSWLWALRFRMTILWET